MKRLPNPFWKLRPDVPSNEVLGTPAEQLRGMPIHVGVAPVLIKRHQTIADVFENDIKLLPDGGSVVTGCLFSRQQLGMFLLLTSGLGNG